MNQSLFPNHPFITENCRSWFDAASDRCSLIMWKTLSSDPVLPLFFEEAIEILQYFREQLLDCLKQPSLGRFRSLSETADYFKFIQEGAIHFQVTDLKLSSQNLFHILKALDREPSEIQPKLKQMLALASEALWMTQQYLNRMRTVGAQEEFEKKIRKRTVNIARV